VEALADLAVRFRFVDLGMKVFLRDQQTPEALGALQKARITGFLVTPGDDGAAPGGLATRANLESGRAAGAPTASLEPSVVFLALLRWCSFGRQLFVDDIRGKVIQSWLPMPDGCLTRDLARGREETGPKRRDFLSESPVSRQRQDRNTNS
jgi:hypothetical protein